MEGYLGHLTKKQQDALEEFKRVANGLLTEDYHDDHFCLRWLRATTFNVGSAKAMLEKSINFRKIWRVDTILTEFKPNIGLRTVSPGGVCGFDKMGGCVLLYPLANTRPEYYFEFSRRSEIVKMVLLRLEQAQLLLRQQSAKLGRAVEKNTVIFDTADFDFAANLSPTALSLYSDMMRTYESNYPETLAHAFVINAPPIFNLFFSFLKPLFSGTTLSKVKIFGKDPSKWKPALLEVIDPEQLPVLYGGTQTSSEGNMRCDDKIVYIDEMNDEVIQQLITRIPENERLRKATLRPRAIHDHVVSIEEANSALKVEFESEGHDIAFALLRQRSSEDSEEFLVANKRYNSHKGTVTVCILCPVAGQYILRFNNSHSSLRSKNIAYNVTTIPSTQVNEDMIMIHEP